MRLRLFRGHIAPSFVSTDMHFREGGCSGESSHASWHCKGGRISDGKNQSI